MERRMFGKTGMLVSPLGFGGAEIGFERADVATVERLLSSALDAGLNVIDTAECYNDSEELIGQTVANRRNDYYLFTKVGHNGGEFGLEDWDPKLLERVERDALTLCRALGYDLNTVEFACEDGIPYAIDFMNPAPDADVNSVGQENFDWIVNAVAELAVKKALSDETSPRELRWSAFLTGEAEARKPARAAGRTRSKPQVQAAI